MKLNIRNVGRAVRKLQNEIALCSMGGRAQQEATIFLAVYDDGTFSVTLHARDRGLRAESHLPTEDADETARELINQIEEQRACVEWDSRSLDGVR